MFGWQSVGHVFFLTQGYFSTNRHLALSMPWYKWWDRTTTPPTYDGVMRENKYMVDYQGQSIMADWIPSVLRQSTSPFGAADMAQLKLGPYANWNNPQVPPDNGPGPGIFS
jgi:hypothetical protein